MNAWVITIPKRTPWATYERELDAAQRGGVLRYRVARAPRGVCPGDRCYVVHDGRVRGWMAITSVRHVQVPWRCSTTGEVWPPGVYLERSGAWHPCDGPAMRGFRGVRRMAALGREAE